MLFEQMILFKNERNAWCHGAPFREAEEGKVL